jgi:hypothetical protein
MAIADLFKSVTAAPVPPGSTSSIHGGTAETRMDKGGSTRFHRFHHKNDKPEKKPEIDRKEGDSIDTSFFANCGGTGGTKSGGIEEHFLTEGEREAFEERAAILEFDGGLSRKDAEKVATRHQETARCWRVVSADGEQLTVTVSPEATRAEILKLYPDAVAVDPFTRPVKRPDAPLTAEEEGAIRAWLDVIEETDPASIACTIEDCQQDREARKYFLGRAAVELPKPATEEKEP